MCNAMAAQIGGKLSEGGAAIGQSIIDGQQAKNEQKLLKRQAKIARVRAKRVIRGGQQRAQIVRDRAAVGTGDVEARFAGAGISIDSGVVADLASRHVDAAEREVQTILSNAEFEAFSLREGAQIAVYQGKSARYQARLSMAGAINTVVGGTATTLGRLGQGRGGEFSSGAPESAAGGIGQIRGFGSSDSLFSPSSVTAASRGL